MIIKPKFRGFICTTAHPAGCEEYVKKQVEYAEGRKLQAGPKNVLVIGASTGYGLASRIVSAFSSGAATIGVFYEKPAADNRTATAGWYNAAAFEKFAHEKGCYAKSINGDAFSNEIKNQTIELIKKDLGKIDLVVYSVATARRTDPDTGITYTSALKPIGRTYTSRTVNFHTGEVSDISLEPANEDEIAQTVTVMGGEDWELWMTALEKAEVLADGVITLAYSYIGPEMTHSIYREGTIGRAKDHLESTAVKLTKQLESIGGKAYVSVNKALVTQASAAIPVVPLYISLLYKVMKERGIHEGCVEQIHRLFADRVYSGNLSLDEKGRLRVDDLEMKPEVQTAVAALWNTVNKDNIESISDIEGYRREFFNLFGFGYPEVDYSRDEKADVMMPSIKNVIS
ncbi:MAG: trans-2-enoyl-CoA reductase family protein [Clostridiales bacterium]|nr:trans-2-enoyl-CoA reductase family protein [Clostridiales bacterium]